MANPKDLSALLNLYLQIAPAELFRVLAKQLGVIRRNGIYTARVVIWMMMTQRLQGGGSLARSVEELAQGRFNVVLSKCKRVREKRVALSTGGYCQARQRLCKLLLIHSMDELLERLRQRLLGPTDASRQRVYVMDGSSVQLEHEAELAKAYPPASNQRGKTHWPLVRLVVLHEVETGLAERPHWGPLNGPQAVSEQALAEQAVEPLPAESIVIGDRNFGIFSIAYRAQQKGLYVVLRLTQVRAKSLLQALPSNSGDHPIHWRPSRWDGKKQRSWPADASVPGRVIVARIGRGKSKQWLYLFTTLFSAPEEVVSLYGRRWHIESDLRSLKQTVGLHRLSVQSTDMMEKELLVAVLAYNLVRAIMHLAAERAGIDPRQLSFTYARNIVLDGYPRILAAPTPRRQLLELEAIVDMVGQCRLPRRTKRRSYPRQVWSRNNRYPVRPREQN